MFLFKLFFFFFNDTAPTEIYPLSLHDALPISATQGVRSNTPASAATNWDGGSELSCCSEITRADRLSRTPAGAGRSDRKSTRLNSSHSQISYAVFCFKKKKTHPPAHRFQFVRI